MATRLYDIGREAERIRVSLSELRLRERPGAITGTGGKRDVLQAVKDDITTLVRDGYTSSQIAAAMATEDFSILPKTVTEVMSRQRPKKAANKRPNGRANGVVKAANAAPNVVANKATNKLAQAAGQFELKPDAF